MHAKLMLFSGSKKAAGLSLQVQRLLTEIAVAFNKSFVIMEDKISRLSIDEYGSSMTEEAIINSKECDAIISLANDLDGVQELCGGLGIILHGHVYHLPECLNEYSRLKTNILPYGVLAYPLFLDQEVLARAADHLYKRAKEENDSISEVSSSGLRRQIWEEVTDTIANKYFAGHPYRRQTDSLLAEILRSPHKMGTVFANKASCEILNACAEEICGLPSFLFDCYWDDKAPKLYTITFDASAPVDSFSPFGILYALVDMLKYSLKLEKEAECLHTCINNVLEAGWRTADICAADQMRIAPEAIFKLISEQVELVAEVKRF